ncbi:MAG: radical SAM protein [Deltaproteobacteria bacterium]|nr:radical SAM protein [Deltaproteobacteria bacterium]
MNHQQKITHCLCCPRGCGVNRLEGQTGFCGVASGIHNPHQTANPTRADTMQTLMPKRVEKHCLVPVSHAGLHFGEEPPISGFCGSGTIFFCGCNLKCVFCQNYQISQHFKDGSYQTLSCQELAAKMLTLQDQGAHNINLVSPTHVVFQVADAIKLARDKGLVIPIVYNSNGYDAVDMLREIKGLIDIYLPDIKYMEHHVAKEYSSAENYPDIIPAVLNEMFKQVGDLKLDANGMAVRGLLVRHLVLPHHITNSKKCLEVIADLSINTCVSLMSQYAPRHLAPSYAKISAPLLKDEYDEITEHALNLGLENAFIQELSSHKEYLPDFSQTKPFG